MATLMRTDDADQFICVQQDPQYWGVCWSMDCGQGLRRVRQDGKDVTCGPENLTAINRHLDALHQLGGDCQVQDQRWKPRESRQVLRFMGGLLSTHEDLRDVFGHAALRVADMEERFDDNPMVDLASTRENRI